VRALAIVQERIAKRLGFIHVMRLNALWRVVTALLVGERLWLTALGRSMLGAARPKHAIKCVDRLLGNPHLFRERFRIAAALTELVIRGTSRPIILVDTVEVRHRYVAITAALAMGGRTLPIWSIVSTHYKVKLGELRRFLDGLKKVLPAGASPILVTDAGFEQPWLRLLDALGWDYIARARGQTQVRIDDKWVALATIRAKAGRRARNLGTCGLPKRDPDDRRIVLSRVPVSKHRQISTRQGPARGTNYHAYRKNAYEPLVLVTSLTSAPEQVVELYRLRMQIEQTFRDLKNHRWGWSMRHCLSKSRDRIEILLLIASIAMLVQHLIGVAGELTGLQRAHQANTVRDRRVLSTFFLGALLLRRAQVFEIRDLLHALRELRRRIRGARDYA
jgi:hypothetical protein